MSDGRRGLGADVGRERQRAIYLRGVAGKRPAVPVDSARLEEAARKAMSREAFAYIAGGAGSEGTMTANRAAFERWRIVPRVLRDVSVRDTSIRLFGQTLPSPLLLAPIGVLEMAHRDADLAVARAAAATGVPMIFSSQASYPMEACAAEMGAATRWFQLYWSRDDALVASFVRRAEACGCDAIVLTLDTTMLGWRARDLDLGYLPFLRGKGIAQYVSDPVFLASLDHPLEDTGDAKPPVNLAAIRTLAQMLRKHPGGFVGNLRSGRARAAVQRFVATYSRPSLTWADLARLREMTKLPILLKGVLHPDDARMAVDSGMDGIVVSNHGGRQVDGAVGALDALPSVVQAAGGRVPVLFDSGVRGGADVFKALALGAAAVCLGRPYAYGLALAGEAGVREVITNLLADFDLTMGLAGCTSVAQITPEMLMR
ncbi:MAG TPA: lactate 2-monooxygenase [Longimicrobiaceae bacterium]|jgi:lactate 2-monooxygenase|nr:lactate 2-monooxygenase [Longimicrobiaceae bacterium]